MSIAANATKPSKIIIDTDPGIDDAMAIFYALSSPKLDVLALTTIFGNTHTTTSTINALRLLDIAGRSEIPVAQGAADNLTGTYRGPADFVHGEDGQGNTHLPESERTAIAASAAELIVELVNAQPGEITLVPLGPLTNIALAIQLDPQLPAKLDQIVLMGGNAFCAGNATAGAEANIYNDPEAADVVLGAACRLVMVGLDVTHKVVMYPHHLRQISEIETPTAQHLAKIIPFYSVFQTMVSGVEELVIHDSTTITYLLSPQLFTWVELPVRVDCGQSVCRGNTLISDRWTKHDGNFQGRPNVRILTDVDADAAVNLELAHLRY